LAAAIYFMHIGSLFNIDIVLLCY